MHVKAHTSNDDHWAKVNPGFSRNRPRMKRNGRPRSFIWRRGEERDIFHLHVFCSRQYKYSPGGRRGKGKKVRGSGYQAVTNPLCYPPLPHPSPSQVPRLMRCQSIVGYPQQCIDRTRVQRKSFSQLAITSPDVISTSPKIFLMSRIDFTVLLVFDFLKKHHLPVGQLKTEFTNPPDSKIHQPRVIGHFFFCTLRTHLHNWMIELISLHKVGFGVTENCKRLSLTIEFCVCLCILNSVFDDFNANHTFNTLKDEIINSTIGFAASVKSPL